MKKARPTIKSSIDPVQRPESTKQALGILATRTPLRVTVSQEVNTQTLGIMHCLTEDEGGQVPLGCTHGLVEEEQKEEDSYVVDPVNEGVGI